MHDPLDRRPTAPLPRSSTGSGSAPASAPATARPVLGRPAAPSSSPFFRVAGTSSSTTPARPAAVTPARRAALEALGTWPPPAAEVDEAAYGRLADGVRRLLGLDLSQYKAPQVWRRVHSFGSTRGFTRWEDLLERCRTDLAMRAAFRDMITINVSEFFRNPEAWSSLRDRYLLPLLKRSGIARIWSAGCSIGFEPYTLAMIIREAAVAGTVRILATDVDETALNAARRGRFTEVQMGGVSPARRTRFFDRDGDEWTVRQELMSLITFRRHDLLRDAYETSFDMVVCRNVVIYFTEAAKAELFARFAAAIRPGGVLFIGATESIHNARAHGLVPCGTAFYEKAAS
jgi:chemotaxis protein methyltransferase CheR